MAELSDRLRVLHAWSGLSYREIHRQVARARRLRGTVEIPALDTVHRCLRPGRVRLDVDLMVDIVTVLLGCASDAEAAAWRAPPRSVTRPGVRATGASLHFGPPRDRVHFVGPPSDLDAIHGHRCARFVTVLAGMPGVGKTARR